ncbi:hypothetical protein V1525DRAFT_412063 [Lipomyces kononenkoae]|uniref:Uncharacterized protein n=1 Tax=Lipomyces kononenkoae TaxID=34357 RepID=A0ACC3ST18_LIPKO
MGRQSKQKACFACVDAKRRCDRALPFCSRCIDRGVTCTYRPAQPRRLSPGGAGITSTLDLRSGEVWTSSGRQAGDQGGILSAEDTRETQDMARIEEPACSTHLVSKVSASSFPSSVASSCTIGGIHSAGQIASFSGDPVWFLHPSAWTVAYHYQPPASLPSGTVFSNFIRGLQTWLSRFHRAGHNPFIHRHLYSETGMPQCMRDAYSAIAVSQDVTQENEHIVDDISSSHISNLLACQHTDGPLSLLLLSTREHLARTQALLIHLLLALFSPSIPRRAKAETLIETLLYWTNQLWESASQDAAAALLVPGVLPLPDGEDRFPPDSTSGLYETFVLTESIRRTWLLCNIATGVYYSHKGDWSSTCAGDVYITARAELWDATSSARWEAVVRQQDPLFVYSLHGRSLVARGVGASEVDEFARHLFTIMWGLDEVEDWVVRTGDTVSIMY